MLEIILEQSFGPLKTKITQFPHGGFYLVPFWLFQIKTGVSNTFWLTYV